MKKEFGKILLLLPVILGECSISGSGGVNSAFLDQVKGKSLYDPTDGQKTGTFSVDGKTLSTEYDSWSYLEKDLSDDRGVYKTGDRFIAIVYNGVNSSYYQTEDFIGHLSYVEIR